MATGPSDISFEMSKFPGFRWLPELSNLRKLKCLIPDDWEGEGLVVGAVR